MCKNFTQSKSRAANTHTHYFSSLLRFGQPQEVNMRYHINNSAKQFDSFSWCCKHATATSTSEDSQQGENFPLANLSSILLKHTNVYTAVRNNSDQQTSWNRDTWLLKIPFRRNHLWQDFGLSGIMNYVVAYIFKHYSIRPQPLH